LKKDELHQVISLIDITKGIRLQTNFGPQLAIKIKPATD